jgi:MFS family permease
MLASRAGTLKVLCGGTLLVGLALAGVGFTHSALILGMLLVLGGAGSSTQHPLSASAISNVYPGKASRVALSTYNFSGDIGKLIIPGTAALLVAYLGWHHAITLMGLFGVLAATIIFLALIRVPLERGSRRERTLSRGGFSFLRPERSSLPYCGLVAIGILDSATRTGFLTFLPFLLQGKGAGVRVVGLALSLIFGGGAAGKFVFGVLAARVGILRSVILTELGTAACIYAMIGLPLKSVLLLCPLFGIVLNGTSSVLYGSVPELVPEACRKEAFAVFYTFTIGAGAIAPSIYGLISDAIGINACVTLVATVVLATLPLTLPLRGKLKNA